jgi:hypothetical protein
MTSVLIVVFDGLQPAQVTAELMPNLTPSPPRECPSPTTTRYSPR